MSDFYILFVELIYPGDYDKQNQLMDDLMELREGAERLIHFTPTDFRREYEKNGYVPFQMANHLEDMVAIMNSVQTNGV